jgi:uncharacterized protein involved in exopolysaccharide biosynthesis
MEKKNEPTVKDFFINLQQTFVFLFSKWKMIILISLFGGGIGLTLSLVSEFKYLGTVKFLIEDDGKSSSGLASLANNFGLSSISGGNSSVFTAPNFLEFLKTRSLVEKALLRPIREVKYSHLTYADFYIKFNKLKKTWGNQSKLKNISFKVNDKREEFSREKDSILASIYTSLIESNQLKVYQFNKDNSILQIEVNSLNEVFSKNFPTELMSVASDYYMETKTGKLRRNVAILQKQTDSVRNELNNSMNLSATATDKIFGLNPSMNIKRVSFAKEQTRTQINSAIMTELIRNLQLAKMSLLEQTPVINVIEEPIYPLFKKKLGKVKGIVFGVIIAGFIICFFYVFKRYINEDVDRILTIKK